jgi:hypothetical protein
MLKIKEEKSLVPKEVLEGLVMDVFEMIMISKTM